MVHFLLILDIIIGVGAALALFELADRWRRRKK